MYPELSKYSLHQFTIQVEYKMKKIKLKSVFIGMLILLGGIHLTYSISGGSTSDPYPAFNIPIYQGGV